MTKAESEHKAASAFARIINETFNYNLYINMHTEFFFFVQIKTGRDSFYIIIQMIVLHTHQKYVYIAAIVAICWLQGKQTNDKELFSFVV